MPLNGSHLRWGLGGSDVFSIPLVNVRTNKKVIFDRSLLANVRSGHDLPGHFTFPIN